jgi:Rab5 GDP/GTP exchange factor
VNVVSCPSHSQPNNNINNMPIDYERFVTQLKAPEGEELRATFQDFLVNFHSGPRMLAYQRKQVSSFLKSINEKSITSGVFGVETDVDIENVSEGWEKLVMSQVFDRVFTGVGDESKANAAVSKKMETFAWIEERHLDLTINFSLNLEIASAELLRINGYKSPRDKLVIMTNVMQLVTDLIKKSSPGSGESVNQDTILPTLILVIIRANPPNMVSLC